MRICAVLLVVGLLCWGTAEGAEETTKAWWYPGLEHVGQSGKLETGNVTHARDFDFQTKDAFLKVVLWYMNKAGVNNADQVIKTLEGKAQGEVSEQIGSSNNLSINGKQANAVICLYRLEPDRAHVTIVKPELENGQTIIVSISGGPSKTSVQFVQHMDSPNKAAN